MDKFFKIKTINATVEPNQLIWSAMHQDVSAFPIYNCKLPDEIEAGRLIVKHLLKSDRGHYGCFEHASIAFNCCYFPHSMVQQLRTHRVGISFDVQSFRYTSDHILKVASSEGLEAEKVFYLRPVGNYSDRQGKKYYYSEEMRADDLAWCKQSAIAYKKKIELGLSEEHARSTIPFDVRQHFVMSCNTRSLMHILDLRWKADAQWEIQQFSELLFDEFIAWTPEVANWYFEKRAKKARLSP